MSRRDEAREIVDMAVGVIVDQAQPSQTTSSTPRLALQPSFDFLARQPLFRLGLRRHCRS